MNKINFIILLLCGAFSYSSAFAEFTTKSHIIVKSNSCTKGGAFVDLYNGDIAPTSTTASSTILICTSPSLDIKVYGDEFDSWMVVTSIHFYYICAVHVIKPEGSSKLLAVLYQGTARTRTERQCSVQINDNTVVISIDGVKKQ